MALAKTKHINQELTQMPSQKYSRSDVVLQTLCTELTRCSVILHLSWLLKDSTFLLTVCVSCMTHRSFRTTGVYRLFPIKQYYVFLFFFLKWITSHYQTLYSICQVQSAHPLNLSLLLCILLTTNFVSTTYLVQHIWFLHCH